MVVERQNTLIEARKMNVVSNVKSKKARKNNNISNTPNVLLRVYLKDIFLVDILINNS